MSLAEPAIFETPESQFEQVQAWRKQGLRVGVVPTMGALHDGHLSLARKSKEQCDRTVATIFVNPTQFGAGEDLSRYPRTWDQDLSALSSLGVDAVFAPTSEAMYPPGCTTSVCPPDVARRWEGEFRPEHFSGVATIVLKLLNVIPADIAFFGQKDYQQSLVVRQMVVDFNLSVRIEVCPIVRDEDGLALSSRNAYLSMEERQSALGIYKSLLRAEKALQDGIRDANAIRQSIVSVLSEHGIERLDYVAIADTETMEPLECVDRAAVVAIAAHVGSTRLIDNVLVST